MVFSLSTYLSNFAESSGFAGQVLANVRTVFSFNAGELTVKNYTQRVKEPLKVSPRIYNAIDMNFIF